MAPFPFSLFYWLFGGCAKRPRRAAAHVKRKILGRPRVTVKAEGELPGRGAAGRGRGAWGGRAHLIGARGGRKRAPLHSAPAAAAVSAAAWPAPLARRRAGPAAIDRDAALAAGVYE